MNPGVIAAFAAFAGVALTGIVTYLVAARRLSGKIATSDAVELWAESARIREHLTQRLDEAYERLEKLERESADQRAEHREQVRLLEARIVVLEAANAALQKENKALGEVIELLKTQVNGPA